MIFVRLVQDALEIVPLHLLLVLVPFAALLLVPLSLLAVPLSLCLLLVPGIAVLLSLCLLRVPIVALLLVPRSLLAVALGLRLLRVPVVALLLGLRLLSVPVVAFLLSLLLLPVPVIAGLAIALSLLTVALGLLSLGLFLLPLPFFALALRLGLLLRPVVLRWEGYVPNQQAEAEHGGDDRTEAGRHRSPSGWSHFPGIVYSIVVGITEQKARNRIANLRNLDRLLGLAVPKQMAVRRAFGLPFFDGKAAKGSKDAKEELAQGGASLF